MNQAGVAMTVPAAGSFSFALERRQADVRLKWAPPPAVYLSAEAGCRLARRTSFVYSPPNWIREGSAAIWGEIAAAR